MSALLETLCGEARRKVCEANDAAMSIRVNRGANQIVSGHAIDLAIQAIGEGFERVEVRPFFRVEDACPADVLSPEEIRCLWEV